MEEILPHTSTFIPSPPTFDSNYPFYSHVSLTYLLRTMHNICIEDSLTGVSDAVKHWLTGPSKITFTLLHHKLFNNNYIFPSKNNNYILYIDLKKDGIKTLYQSKTCIDAL